MASGRSSMYLKSYAPFLSRPGTTFAEAVRYIADVCGLPVGSLSPALNAETEHYGWNSFGISDVDLASIAKLFSGLEWDVRSGVLHMERDSDATKAERALDRFDEIAGLLMVKAERKGRNLADGEYDRIASELDRQRIGLRDNLEPRFKDALTIWNQRNGRTGLAVHTWVEAVNSKGIGRRDGVGHSIREGALKTLKRAEATYRKAAGAIEPGFLRSG